MTIFDISFYGLHISPTWYGLSYALGFITCYFFVRRFYIFSKKEHIDTLLSYIFVGVILGGRLGYVTLYNLAYFSEHPISIFKIWEWGMSFHGGLLWVVIAVYLFAWRYSYQFWSLIDTLAVIIPVALGLGRVGNWINQELPGYAYYDGVFPMMIGWISHFPSPLLEMLLEGIYLLIVMLISWRFFSKKNPWFLSGVFLVGYSVARLIAEQYRLPDSHIGYIFSTDWMTLGILYTIPMLGYGVYLVTRKYPL
jgi:phosphatidylglycerol---prolipoprotein diacylglyceryl transferase